MAEPDGVVGVHQYRWGCSAGARRRTAVGKQRQNHLAQAGQGKRLRQKGRRVKCLGAQAVVQIVLAGDDYNRNGGIVPAPAREHLNAISIAECDVGDDQFRRVRVEEGSRLGAGSGDGGLDIGLGQRRCDVAREDRFILDNQNFGHLRPASLIASS